MFGFTEQLRSAGSSVTELGHADAMRGLRRRYPKCIKSAS